jgi:shikimate 5-dehydrogenase
LKRKLRGNYAVIFGAGGTSKSAFKILSQLNLKIIVFNRSFQRLEKFNNCDKFTDWDEFKEFILNKNIALIFSAIPAENSIYDKIFDELFDSTPLIFETSYIPKNT